MSATLGSVFKRKLIFVSGKGGVGKTVVSQALALALSRSGARTLWTVFEDPFLPLGEVRAVGPALWHLNCDPGRSFEEYAALKIGGARLTKIFLQNKLVRYLAKAAPGLRELVLLGKVWHEAENFDHIVVDMPSTGYCLAMFQSTDNFSKLFRVGPLHNDAEAMLETFRDAKQSGYLILALPEEMPLVEGLELNDYLHRLFPKNPAAFLVNRVFPRMESHGASHGATSIGPIASSTADFVHCRNRLERQNLKLWKEAGVSFEEIEYVSPSQTDLIACLAEGLWEKR